MPPPSLERDDSVGTRGRPRDPALDEAILEAAAALLAEAGFDALTMEQVATRAGVSKASLYRRFENLSDLLAATCVAFAPEVPETPDTGSAREDLTIVLSHLAEMMTSPDKGGPLPAILAAAGSDENARRALSRFSSSGRKPLQEVASRAIERGELHSGLEPESVADMLAGAVLFRVLVRDADAGSDRIDSYLDLLLGAGR